jgi:hypothetical protein
MCKPKVNGEDEEAYKFSIKKKKKAADEKFSHKKKNDRVSGKYDLNGRQNIQRLKTRVT